MTKYIEEQRGLLKVRKPLEEGQYLRRPPSTHVFQSPDEVKSAVADARFRLAAIHNFLEGGKSKDVLDSDDVRKFRKLVRDAQDDLMEIEHELDRYEKD